MGPAFGCIADDYTGATDVAAAFRRGGLRTVLVFGQPASDLDVPDCDALVVALKSRTVPAGDAVAWSLAVKRWLADAGARRFYFKYCSTFDSTDAGNIGPVTDALLDDLGSDLTLICPATPMQGRTIYQGHLFVGDRLLSESSMRHHPLTPMTEPNGIWTTDFKGQFKTRDGVYCYPLTLVDGFSRYLLACQGLRSTALALARPIFRRAFEEYGLPRRIRSDNGVPFATTALGRLSRLAVWWIRLGIYPELIEPAHPEQNGRHERMHRTLKAEVLKGYAQTGGG